MALQHYENWRGNSQIVHKQPTVLLDQVVLRVEKIERK